MAGMEGGVGGPHGSARTYLLVMAGFAVCLFVAAVVATMLGLA